MFGYASCTDARVDAAVVNRLTLHLIRSARQPIIVQ